MIAVIALDVLDSTYQPAARCVVCGNDIGAGEGVTARYGDRTLRFKCPGCLARFRSDPDRFLADHQAGCCSDGDAGCSPQSEWSA